MRKIHGRRTFPSDVRAGAPLPKSTCASSPASLCIRRNGSGLFRKSRATNRRTL
jgi:hypothetical protein